MKVCCCGVDRALSSVPLHSEHTPARRPVALHVCVWVCVCMFAGVPLSTVYVTNAQEVMFSSAFVCLWDYRYAKTSQQIFAKFGGNMVHATE